MEPYFGLSTDIDHCINPYLDFSQKNWGTNEQTERQTVKQRLDLEWIRYTKTSLVQMITQTKNRSVGQYIFHSFKYTVKGQIKMI